MLAFKGLVLGFIFSVALVSGTVWCAQVSLRQGLLGGLQVALALALAQLVHCGLALVALYGLLLMPINMIPWLRGLAILVFLYFAIKMFRAPRATTLEGHSTEILRGRLFSATFVLAVTMPMRLGGYLALAIAAGLPGHGLTQISVPVVASLAGLGSFAWFAYIVTLAVIFGHRVPEPITLRSINKLNFLSGAIFILTALITFLPLLTT